MTLSSERHLVEAVTRGDRAALGQLLARYQHRLYNVVLRMVSHRDDAAEVTQDAMVKIIENIDHFRGDSQVGTWMIRIAMNLSISHLRRRQTRQMMSLDAERPGNGQTDNPDPPGTLGDRIADTRELSPEARVQRDELVAQLHRAMNRLEPDFRAALVLRDIDDMDYQQMAEVLGIPLGTVKSRLFRARLALRQEMATADAHVPTNAHGLPTVGPHRLGGGSHD